MRKVLIALPLALTLAGTWGCQGKPEPAAPAASTLAGAIDRTVLPIAEPNYPHDHRTRRAEGHAAAAVRGKGAGRRA